MEISLKQAAEVTGKSKPTILRALQSGKISGRKDENGEWKIAPSELDRVFPPVKRTDTDETQKINETLVLRRELELLHEQRRRDHELIEDLRKDRDQWRQQATSLLTHDRPKAQNQPVDGLRVRLARWIAGNP